MKFTKNEKILLKGIDLAISKNTIVFPYFFLNVNSISLQRLNVYDKISEKEYLAAIQSLVQKGFFVPVYSKPSPTPAYDFSKPEDLVRLK